MADDNSIVGGLVDSASGSGGGSAVANRYMAFAGNGSAPNSDSTQSFMQAYKAMGGGQPPAQQQSTQTPSGLTPMQKSGGVATRAGWLGSSGGNGGGMSSLGSFGGGG